MQDRIASPGAQSGHVLSRLTLDSKLTHTSRARNTRIDIELQGTLELLGPTFDQ